MKSSKKSIITAIVAGSLSVSAIAIAEPVIKDISAKFNPGIKYTLNGKEIMEGKGALVYEDRVYIPVRDVSESLGIDVDYKDNTVILEQNKSAIFIEKTASMKFNGKDYEIKVAFPEEIADYVTLEPAEEDNMCLVRFDKDEKTANIGSFTFFSEDEYDAMDPTQMPVPTEALRQDGIVIGFTGVQDSVFEIGTEEADLVENYHSQTANILKTLKLA